MEICLRRSLKPLRRGFYKAEYEEHIMADSLRIQKILGISRAEFGLRYHIPIRTLEDWDRGLKTPPVYVVELLERAVLEDKK